MIARISPRKLRGTVAAIPSKSEAHRALICAALADAPTRILMGEGSEDISATIRCLTAFGAHIERTDFGLRVEPITEPPSACDADCGESGSTLRFLLPVAAALGIDARFHMRGRLPERPIAPLDRELARGGCEITHPEHDVLRIRGKLRPGEYKLPGDVSSQYISGLLFALPLLAGESRLTVTGKRESVDYVAMTLQTLARFGVEPEIAGASYIIGRTPGKCSSGEMRGGNDGSSSRERSLVEMCGGDRSNSRERSLAEARIGGDELNTRERSPGAMCASGNQSGSRHCFLGEMCTGSDLPNPCDNFLEEARIGGNESNIRDCSPRAMCASGDQSDSRNGSLAEICTSSDLPIPCDSSLEAARIGSDETNIRDRSPGAIGGDETNSRDCSPGAMCASYDQSDSRNRSLAEICTSSDLPNPCDSSLEEARIGGDESGIRDCSPGAMCASRDQSDSRNGSLAEMCTGSDLPSPCDNSLEKARISGDETNIRDCSPAAICARYDQSDSRNCSLGETCIGGDEPNSCDRSPGKICDSSDLPNPCDRSLTEARIGGDELNSRDRSPGAMCASGNQSDSRNRSLGKTHVDGGGSSSRSHTLNETCGSSDGSNSHDRTLEEKRVGGTRSTSSYHSPGEIRVGGDWSNAAFWLCADALPGCAVTVTGLDESSAQGDRRVAEELRRMKCREGTLDAADIPDLVPILAATVCARGQALRVVHAGRLRIKESDRLASVTRTLRALGGDVTETEDGLIVAGNPPASEVPSPIDPRIHTDPIHTCDADAYWPGFAEESAAELDRAETTDNSRFDGTKADSIRQDAPEARRTPADAPACPLTGGAVDACGDHRIAMMAAVASCACAGDVVIRGAEAVNKSYPGFWRDFAALGGCVTLTED